MYIKLNYYPPRPMVYVKMDLPLKLVFTESHHVGNQRQSLTLDSSIAFFGF